MTNFNDKRFCYERLDSNPNPHATLFLTLVYPSSPNVMPFIEGYRYIGEVRTLTPTTPEWKTAPNSNPTASKLKLSCISRPCNNLSCASHRASPYHYWSEQLGSWYDCGHYYHTPESTNECQPTTSPVGPETQSPRNKDSEH